ncbi:head-tail adaptor protein [Pseudohalocynthiibacter sp. F2068]|jgi:head-tail adaptor|uniref:head-tail adaptor protein n=1 Tax=Pseudohalocynthiibacter sp. F2068 TaxID=2926418 RepID=UPI001FF547EA|nr:head-tail adaptor protein [Pseudohalocynthiibacter sp. F2068]MCK0101660.1 head-tail adaptor protein [Pseudohalocynthiibacter sp. F2068]
MAVRLNRKLELQEALQIADGAGGFTKTWSSLGTLWAELEPGSGSESADQLLTLSSVPYRITVRGAPDGAPSRPKPDQRFIEGSRVFRILAVTERDLDGRYLICFTREEVAS